MQPNFFKQSAIGALLLLCLSASPSFAQYDSQIRAMAWFLQGMAYSNDGDFNRAIYAFDQVIRLNPSHTSAWFCKGVALARTGRKAEALVCVKQALRLDPGYANDPNVYGLLHSLGLVKGPAPQPVPYPNLGRAGGVHNQRECEDDMCYQCHGTGEIAASGNAYSGAGYQPARRCPNCGGTGRKQRCY